MLPRWVTTGNRARSRGRLLAAIIACALPGAAGAQSECGLTPASWVFCTGFEEGSFDQWDDWDGNPAPTNTIVADPGPFNRAGNHVARLFVPAGGGNADLTKVLPGGDDILYARWYVKWEAGFDFTTPQHGSGLHAGDRALLGRSGYRPDGTDWFSAFIEPGYGTGRFNAYTYYPGMYMNCVDPDGSCWGDDLPCTQDEGQVYCTKPQHRESVTPPLMQSGHWYCIEMMLAGGAPTPGNNGAGGVLNYWIDGQEIGPWNDLWLRSTGDLHIGILWLNLFFHGAHGPAGVLFDDVVVSSSPIGPRSSSTPVESMGWGTMKAMFR
jgi:hypothetical protein